MLIPRSAKHSAKQSAPFSRKQILTKQLPMKHSPFTLWTLLSSWPGALPTPANCLWLAKTHPAAPVRMIKEPSHFIPQNEQVPRPSNYSFPAPKRTVYTWRVSYRIEDKTHQTLSGGLNRRFLNRNCDGGPYLTKESAITAALKARGELTDNHGASNVGRYEIQSHQAPVSQPAFP